MHGQRRVARALSPSFYHQRKEYYAGVCEVRPLLFKWGRLKAQQLKMLMKLDESSTQLYVSLMLEMLRGYQRRRKVPPYLDFLSELEALCSSQQPGPLRQRIQLLSAFVWEAECNEALHDVGADLAEVMAAGRMIVVDLTDPMMAPADANGVFQVLLETFRFKQVHGAGKLVVFDEAHRYMGLGGEGDAPRSRDHRLRAADAARGLAARDLDAIFEGDAGGAPRVGDGPRHTSFPVGRLAHVPLQEGALARRIL